MPQTSLAGLVRSLHASARRTADVSDKDQELLDRFVQRRDEDAFRALVNRHGKGVMAACRQVLDDPADVDDAFQATFLVLLRKAKSLDSVASLGGWLFAVAHRVAVRCHSDRHRRQVREAEAARRVRESVQPPDLSVRETAAILHSELNALPDAYRLPILLCCVRGLSRDEAAAELGITFEAVRWRLERGRALLQRRLAKRGVMLSAGLLAALVGGSRATGGPSAALIDLTVQAGGGVIRPAVAALVRGATSMIFVKKKAMAIALVLTGLVTLSIGLGVRMRAASAQDKQIQNREHVKLETKPDSNDSSDQSNSRTITGKVMGPDGKPVQAELKMVWSEGQPQSLGSTNPDGTFSLTVPIKRGEHGGSLIATAANCGLDALPSGIDYLPQSKSATAEVTFRLPKERVITGRVLDQQGKPVNAGNVLVRSVHSYGSDEAANRQLREWAALGENGGLAVVPPPETEREVWYFGRTGRIGSEQRSPISTKTDDDGRFVLHGIGAGQVAVVFVTGEGIATRRFVTVNRDGFDPAPLNKALRGGIREAISLGGRWEVYGPDPVLIVEPEKRIRGKVVGVDGKPQAGVRVTFTRVSPEEMNPYFNSTVSGVDGTYEIRGACKRAGYTVETSPNSINGLLATHASAADTAGYEPITIDLTCVRGVIVTGTVTNKATGKPVASQIHVTTWVKNPFAKEYPSPDESSAAIRAESMRTDANGRYRIVTIPGPVLLSADPLDLAERITFRPAVADANYKEHFTTEYGMLLFNGPAGGRVPVQGCSCSVINGKKTDTELNVDLAFELASKIEAKIADADGNGLTGVRIAGVAAVDPYLQQPAPTDTISLYGIEPKSERLVAAVHPQKKLIGTMVVKGDDKNTVIKLGTGSAIAGRCTNREGKPLAGLSITVWFAHQQVFEAYHGLVGNVLSTDSNGEFHIESVPPEQEFQLTFAKGGKSIGPNIQSAPKYQIKRDGEMLKLGDLKFDPAN
jgi:RNA polymerase sigma factor (sigma-70 family)